MTVPPTNPSRLQVPGFCLDCAKRNHFASLELNDPPFSCAYPNGLMDVISLPLLDVVALSVDTYGRLGAVDSHAWILLRDFWMNSRAGTAKKNRGLV